MLVEFKKGNLHGAPTIFIESDRVVGLSWGGMFMGQAVTDVELDTGAKVAVCGDMEDTAARINSAKGRICNG